ncbi:RNA polymerase sigma factor [Pedobacter sp. GR22-6]|uniref:RNA polymerase sigma factor n=1 Tax=Pedobacter sp. GR22-6 TaxID=3127957 RepID=UPI00307FA532
MRSKYYSYSDAQLAELTLQQDDYAYKELYERYWPQLFSFARRLLRDEEDAKDVIQETFIKLHTKLSSIEVEQSVRSYLYRSVRNAIIDRAKHDKIKGNYIEGIRQYMEAGYEHADAQLQLKELSALIESEIEKLPPKMRAIFELSRKQYMSHKEIAEEVGIDEKTVKKQLSNAIIRLRSRLGCFFWLQIMSLVLWINRS